jgi:hypothetical protein
MIPTIISEDQRDKIELERMRQRLGALEAENRGLRTEIRRLRVSQATTALIRKPKAKR